MREKFKNWLKNKILDLFEEPFDDEKFSRVSKEYGKSKEYEFVFDGYVRTKLGEDVTDYYIKKYKRIKVHPEVDEDKARVDMVAVYTGLDKHEFNGEKPFDVKGKKK